MFYSRCLLSRNGPLGVIWAAAYCFKRLKKAQVFQTDISSSVDEILQNEFDAVTYRVLAYLLLGLVRIYSKKVEYLFDECNDVLIKINDFVAGEKSKSRLDTLCLPYCTITLPERFELDAFDLEILEDVGGDNVLPLEEITLKDGASKTGDLWQHSRGKDPFQEFDAWHDSCSTDYLPAEDIFASHSTEIGMNVSTSHDFSNIEASMEELRGNSFTREEWVNPVTFSGIEEDASEPIEPFGGYHNIEGEQIPEMAQSENEVQGEIGTAMLQDERFHRVGEEPIDLITLYGENHQSDGERNDIPGLAAQLEKKMCLPINEEDNLTNLQASMEKLQDHRFPQEVCMDVEMFCRSEEPSVLIKPSSEEHHTDAEPMKSLEILLPGNDKCQWSTGEDPVSITVDATAQSKFPDAPGESTTGFMVVHTPATKERARILKRRKCCFDDVTLFPNHLVRQYIEDASDLVSKRRKVPQTALTAWRALRISNLSQGFLVPLLPFISSQLTSLFCEERLKIAETAKTVEPSEPESPDVGRSMEQMAVVPKIPTAISLEQISIASETPTAISLEQMAVAQETPTGISLEQIAIASEAPTAISLEQMAAAPQTPPARSLEQMAIAAETPTARSLEQTAIAPETPTARSLEQMAIAPETPTARSLEKMAIAPETPTVRSSKQMAIDPETPSGRSEQMTLVPETPIIHLMATTPPETPESHKNSHSDMVRLAHSCQIVEEEPSSSKDQGFDPILMTEETNLFEGDDQELHELSARTRMVARYLHRIFLYHKQRRENEAVNVLQLLKGKTKKESARLFYEILVLKTKEYVEVKQDDAYGDILVQKAPQWDQSHGILYPGNR